MGSFYAHAPPIRCEVASITVVFTQFKETVVKFERDSHPALVAGVADGQAGSLYHMDSVRH